MGRCPLHTLGLRRHRTMKLTGTIRRSITAGNGPARGYFRNAVDDLDLTERSSPLNLHKGFEILKGGSATSVMKYCNHCIVEGEID